MSRSASRKFWPMVLAGLFGSLWQAPVVAADQSAALTRHCMQLARANAWVAAQGERGARRLMQGEANYSRSCSMFGDWRALIAGAPSTAPAAPRIEEPSPSVAPTASTPRVQTPGSFTDWDKAIEAECRVSGGGPDARTRCAQVKIERAISEGRLTQDDVVACVPDASVSRPGSTERSVRQREVQARRQSALGGDALWKWEDREGCALAQRVRLTFADSSETKVTAQAQAGCVPQASGGKTCGDADTLVPQGYADIGDGEFLHCISEAVPGTTRAQCAEQAIQKGRSAGVVSSQAVAACRAGARAEAQSVDTHTCLSERARLEVMTSSRVLQARARTSPPKIEVTGYKRGDLIGHLSSADWPWMPRDESLPVYALNLYGKLDEACPDTGYAATMQTLVKRRTEALREALRKVAGGQGQVEDIGPLLTAAGGLLAGMEDCYRRPQWETQTCLEEQRRRTSLPPSPEADHDARRWLQQFRCSSAETRRLTDGLSQWLLLPDAQRGSMVWALKHPRGSEYSRLFENCRLQAGAGQADSWCGCYARQHSLTTPGTRATPQVHVDTAWQSAFVGESGAWFQPADLNVCERERKLLELWRSAQRQQQRGTACLVGQQAVADSVRPELQACRYRTAWGEIEFRSSPECRPRLFAHQWGGNPVSCE
ncbi:MAG: hypothetical protein MUF16_07810 [Burkholderiaceae bacterium]|nr:hypothetical protein [Burkholderiaceae bacterium]